MKIVDQIGKEKSKGFAEQVKFLLSNRNGGFCILGNSSSRFDGLFFRDNVKSINDNVFKVIDSFKFYRKVDKVINKLSHVERRRGDIKEIFFMPLHRNSFYYEFNREVEFDLMLDCREIYDNRVWGRNYEMYKRKKCLMIKYSKKNDPREESGKEYEFYIAIYGKDLEYLPLQNWEKVIYEDDKKRNSPPYERFLFKLVRVKCKELSIGFGKDEYEAIREAKYLFRRKDKLMNEMEKHIADVIHKKALPEGEKKIAYMCALNSLDCLKVKNHICAGLPWFFQFWSRDELISNNEDALYEYLNSIGHDGRLSNIIPESEIGSADSIGWLFHRVEEYIDKNKVSKKFKKLVLEKLHVSLANIIKFYVKEGLVYNNPQETWMDSYVGQDTREGWRIEIQALTLGMFRLLRKLGDSDPYEEVLRNKVRKEFFRNGYLWDGKNDPTKRPNIFIAAYVYPELLSLREWKNCIKNILPHIWLDWGGLSTIEKNSPLFTSKHTGENPQSYHRGDSWFWINNLAAIVMYQIDKNLFRDYIYKILQASTWENLYYGITGSSAELSSANELKSEGCLCQAWSNAMYIELINEIYKNY